MGKKVKEGVQTTRNCARLKRGTASSRATVGEGQWQGRELQEQNLAHPPVRPKKIVPLKMAEVVLTHTEASEPRILSLIPQIC